MLKQGKGVLNPNGKRTAAPGKLKVLLGFLKELLFMMSIGKISPLKLKSYNFSNHYHYYKLHNIH
jgi:hypothetical protein